MNALFYILTSYPRYKACRSLQKKSEEFRKTLDTLVDEQKNATAHGAHSIAEIYSIAINLCIISIDLSALAYRIVAETNRDIQNVYARQTILLIYEFLKDHPNITGKSFILICNKLPKGSEHISITKNLGKEVRELRKDHFDYFHKIRNGVVGHKILQGEDQNKLLSSIDPKEIFDIAVTLQSIIDRLINLCCQITNDYRMSNLMMTEIIKNIEPSNREVREA